MIINQMTDSEAAKILELDSSFTGVEELSTYRKLVRMYHPDNYEMASEEEKNNAHNKMLKINEAHDYLKKKYFSNASDINKRVTISNSYTNYSNYNQNKNNDLSDYKDKIIRRISEKMQGKRTKTYPAYFIEIVDRIIAITTMAIFQTSMSASKDEIDKIFEQFEKDAFNIYRELLEKYCNINNLKIEIVSDKISYNSSIIEFYDQLEKIRVKYQSNNLNKEKYQQILQQEIKKYKTYYGFDKLEDKINRIVNDTLENMELNNFYNAATDILLMHNGILLNFKDYFMSELRKIAKTFETYAGYNNFIKNCIEFAINDAVVNAEKYNFATDVIEKTKSIFNNAVYDLFKTSYSIIQKISDLKKLFEDNSNLIQMSDFSKQYDALLSYEKRFNLGNASIYDLNLIEKSIKSLLEKYNKKMELANNKEYIDAYQNFINRFNSRLSLLNPISDYEEIQNINRIYNSVQNILTKVLKDQIDLEKLIMCLESITFEDYDLDFKLINALTPLKSDIYLKQDWNSRISLYLLKIKDGKRYLYRNGSSYDETEVNDDLAGFTSLDDMINSSTFVGKNAIKLENPGKGQHLYILYRYNDVVFYLNERFANHVLVKQGLHYQLKDEMDLSDMGLKYQNKDLFIEELRTKLEAKYQETSKKDEKDNAVKSRI